MAVAARQRATQQSLDAPPAASGEARRDGRRALALFLLCLGWYLLTGSGHLGAVDEETLFRTTESIVERRTLALPPDAWGLVTSEQAAGGALYSQYEPGQSLLAVPFYLLGKALASPFPASARNAVARFGVSLFGAVVTAATVALLYALARALGYRAGSAAGLALLYALATMAWPYARTFYAEPLTALCLLAALYGLRRGTLPGGGRGWLLGAGLAAGASLSVKPHAALALPFLGLYLLGRAGLPGGGMRATLRRWAAPTLAWGGGLLMVTMPFLITNTALYGGPLRTGYSTGRLTNLAYPFVKGLYGLTISSGKGILWYSPPLLLALLAARPFYRRHRAEALACLGIVAAHLAFYARITLWNGDWAWGPRYLLIALPFALLPAVAFLDGARGRWSSRAIIATVAALGVAVQLLGVLVNSVWGRSPVYDLATSDADRAVRVEARYFSPPASPLAVHARFLAGRLGEWRDRALPAPDTATLAGGFAATEGGALFPRWTTGAGEIALHAGGHEPLTVKLTFFDHRPPSLRDERPWVLVNGARLPDDAIERVDFSGTGEGWTYQFTVPAPALRGNDATVTLASPPWNPRASGLGDRDENLGAFVHNVEVWRAGQPWTIREPATATVRRAIPPLPADPERLYDWFNGYEPFGRDPSGAVVHHLTDHWAWYLAVAGLDRLATIISLVAYATLTAGCALVGLVLLLRAAPAIAPRPTARAQRRGRRRTVATHG